MIISQPQPIRLSSCGILLAACILLAAFTMRVWQLDTQSLWHDEGWSVFAGYTPFGPMGIRSADVNAPAGYYSSLAIWLRLMGDSVWAMRLWSAMLGTIGVACGIAVARRLFGTRAAILGGLLLAFNPILWVFSQEIRAYIPMPMFAVILLGLLHRLLGEHPPRRIWLAVGLAELYALYVQNLAVPLVAWLNVAALVGFMLKRQWRNVLAWLILQAILLVAYLPWLLTQRPTGTVLNAPPLLQPRLVWDIWASMFTGIKNMVVGDGIDPVLMGLLAIFAAITLLCLWRVLQRDRSRAVLLTLSQVLLLPLFELGIIYAAHIDFHPRYFILSVPATLLLVAYGAVLPTSTRRNVSRWAWAGALGVAVMGLMIMARMAWLTFSSSIYQHDDFYAIAQRYAKLGPNDAIIIPYGYEPSLDYYRAKMDWQAKVVEIPYQSTADHIMQRTLAAMQGVQRVEVLTWYQLPADLKATYPCLLGAMGHEADTFTVSGISTNAFVIEASPTLSELATTPTEFGAMRLVQTQLLQSKAGGPCVISHWQRAHADAPIELSVVIRVLTPLGTELERRNVSLLNDKQLPPPFWGDAETNIAFGPLFMALAPNDVTYPITISLFNPLTQQAYNGMQGEKSVGLDVSVGTFTKLGHTPQVFQLQPTDLQVDDGLYMRLIDLPATLRVGQLLPLSIQWGRTGSTLSQQTVHLLLVGEGWQTQAELAVPSMVQGLTWATMRVPVQASGKATLQVQIKDQAPILLRTYTIPTVERHMTPPDDAGLQAVPAESATFAEIGQVIAVHVPAVLRVDNVPTISLVWQASATPPQDYTVFVHLVSPQGEIIAQADGMPVNGERPTTSWLAGEYITDIHPLVFNRPNYRGALQVRVGLYDPATGQRVLLTSGTDSAMLPVRVTTE